jgi:hypothetical protein
LTRHNPNPQPAPWSFPEGGPAGGVCLCLFSLAAFGCAASRPGRCSPRRGCGLMTAARVPVVVPEAGPASVRLPGARCSLGIGAPARARNASAGPAVPNPPRWRRCVRALTGSGGLASSTASPWMLPCCLVYGLAVLVQAGARPGCGAPGAGRDGVGAQTGDDGSGGVGLHPTAGRVA